MSTAHTILVADDSLTIRKLVETVLCEEGYQVTTVTTGADCLSQAAAQKPSLILLDYILPDMQGTEVCRSLINSPETWEVPVLMMSSNGNAIRQLYQDLNNVADYLTKPFAPSVLKAVVGHLLHKEEQPAEVVAASGNGSEAVAAAAAEPGMPREFMDKVSRLLDLMENQPGAQAPSLSSRKSSESETAAAPRASGKARKPRRSRKTLAAAPAPAALQRKFRLALQKHLRSRMPLIPEWESSRGLQDPVDFFLGRLLSKEMLDDLSGELVKATGVPPEAAGALRCPASLVPLDAVLQYLQTSRATGELRIETGEETVLACAEQGRVVLLTSNHPRNYCAGAVCDFQTVPHAVITEAVRAQEQQSIPFFTSLKNLGHLPAQSSLDELLLNQGENCLARAYKSSQAVATFFPLTRLSTLARSSKGEFALNRLLLACYRTVDDWFTLEKVIPDMDVTLEPASDLAAQARELTLDPEENRVLEGVVPGRTIRQVADAVQRKPFEVCRILFRFIKLGLIRQETRQSQEPRAEAPAPTPLVAVQSPAPPTEEVPAPGEPGPTEPAPAAPGASEAKTAEPGPASEPNSPGDPAVEPPAASALEPGPEANSLTPAEGESPNPQPLDPSPTAEPANQTL